jgi:hypothetical protein
MTEQVIFNVPTITRGQDSQVTQLSDTDDYSFKSILKLFCFSIFIVIFSIIVIIYMISVI